ncbi:hypothetical protein B14911_05686 [Bacillus sp. NRRL B-14911]|nr:hypothetical protein B14911_05686 [Bacillus sp. NRRL B-14911]
MATSGGKSENIVFANFSPPPCMMTGGNFQTKMQFQLLCSCR